MTKCNFGPSDKERCFSRCIFHAPQISLKSNCLTFVSLCTYAIFLYEPNIQTRTAMESELKWTLLLPNNTIFRNERECNIVEER